MNLIQFADKYLGNYKTTGKELKVQECPFCKRKKWKFYINTSTGQFICHSGSCNEKGGMVKLKHKFGIEIKFKESLKNTEIPNQECRLNITPDQQLEFKPLTDDMYKWWKQCRSISKETLDFAMVCSRHKKGTKPVIVFPYKYYSELKMIKYRDYSFDYKYLMNSKAKKVWQENGGIPVLWGIDQINYKEPVILTEGEPDRLSWIEAGYKNVVSVPFGTSNSKWIDVHLKDIEKMEEIYICFDEDAAGRKAEKEIITRLGGIVKLKKIIKGTYNDINNILTNEGKDKLIEIYEHAEYYKTEGITNAFDVYVDTEVPEFTRLFPEVDKSTGGFQFGEVVVWSAYTGCGKTTLLTQMALKSISQNYKVCYYSGEDRKEDLQLKLALQMFGSDGVKEKFHQATQQLELFPTEESCKGIREKLKDKLFYIQDENILTDSSLESKMLDLIIKHGVRIFIVDNLMQIDFDPEVSKVEAQKRFFRKLIRFSNKYNIQVHVVAHNKKPQDNKTQGKTYDVSGSSDMVNLSHMVVSIDRLSDKEKQEVLENTGIEVSGRIRTLKKRKRFGNQKDVFLKFNNKYQAFYDFRMKEFEHIELNNNAICNMEDIPTFDEFL